MFRDFEDVTKDIGTELKETARRIYTRCQVIAFLIAIVAVISGIVLAIDLGEFGVLLYFLLGAAAELLIFLGVAHLITINLYAKGELVHLVRHINDPSQQIPVPVVPEKKPEPVMPEAAPEDDSKRWFCTNCGAENSINYGQCKKCGTYR